MRRRALLIVASSSAASGCGFALRQAPVLPFRRIQLVGFGPQSPLAEALSRELARSAQVVLANDRPEVLLLASKELRDKGVVAATTAGQLREVKLRIQFEYRLTNTAGRELIPTTAIVLARDMSYNESFALAKEQEEVQLYAAMQAEIVMQVLRRLASAAKL